ncbi:MAG: phosphatidylserine decarboxylase family protein [Chitinophagales bacterium]|nr:phosphatidylserine decarboxylase family protein [Chitinophagales bacterium]
MRIHKEGMATLILVGAVLLLLNFLFYKFIPFNIIVILLAIISIGFYLFIISFFRNPKRNTVINTGEVISPCDGKVVVIEETEETEYFKEKRIQVSIFMSPLNVHVNYNPISGMVKFVQYHPGKHLVAWHPKSSTDNERSTVVIADGGNEILVRQIAGAVARRIVTYSKVGAQVTAGNEFGFIKFGSRVDLFFPVNAKIFVELNATIKGGETVVGKLIS